MRNTHYDFQHAEIAHPVGVYSSSFVAAHITLLCLCTVISHWASVRQASVLRLSPYWGAVDRQETKRRNLANENFKRQLEKAAIEWQRNNNATGDDQQQSANGGSNHQNMNLLGGLSAAPSKPSESRPSERNDSRNTISTNEINNLLTGEDRPLRLYAMHTRELRLQGKEGFTPESHHSAEEGWLLRSVSFSFHCSLYMFSL